MRPPSPVTSTSLIPFVASRSHLLLPSLDRRLPCQNLRHLLCTSTRRHHHLDPNPHRALLHNQLRRPFPNRPTSHTAVSCHPDPPLRFKGNAARGPQRAGPFVSFFHAAGAVGARKGVALGEDHADARRRYRSAYNVQSDDYASKSSQQDSRRDSISENGRGRKRATPHGREKSPRSLRTSFPSFPHASMTPTVLLPPRTPRPPRLLPLHTQNRQRLEHDALSVSLHAGRDVGAGWPGA